MSSETSGTSGTSAGLRAAVHRWPTALGLAAVGVALAGEVGAETPAITVCVAALCYLGAAALGRPWIAWAGVPAGSAVVVVGELIGSTWWAALAVTALVLLAAGSTSRTRRPATAWQTAAAVGFGVPAVAAVLLLAPRAGLVVAGVVLAGHAAWDLVHLRSGRVVPRSLAEFCIALDVPLGLGCVLLAALAG
jgi:hypothetical protein